jgi:hypothetical protein
MHLLQMMFQDDRVHMVQQGWVRDGRGENDNRAPLLLFAWCQVLMGTAIVCQDRLRSSNISNTLCVCVCLMRRRMLTGARYRSRRSR